MWPLNYKPYQVYRFKTLVFELLIARPPPPHSLCGGRGFECIHYTTISGIYYRISASKHGSVLPMSISHSIPVSGDIIVIKSRSRKIKATLLVLREKFRAVLYKFTSTQE